MRSKGEPFSHSCWSILLRRGVACIRIHRVLICQKIMAFCQREMPRPSLIYSGESPCLGDICPRCMKLDSGTHCKDGVSKYNKASLCLKSVYTSWIFCVLCFPLFSPFSFSSPSSFLFSFLTFCLPHLLCMHLHECHL